MLTKNNSATGKGKITVQVVVGDDESQETVFLRGQAANPKKRKIRVKTKPRSTAKRPR